MATRSTKPSGAKEAATAVDRKRSLAAKKGAVTRAKNRELAAKRQLKVHHKLVAGGMIAAVLVLAFLGIRSQLDAYAATKTAGTFTGLAGKCLDNYGNRAANNNRVNLWGCNGTNAQRWVVVSDGAVKSASGTNTHCLDVPGNSKADGAGIQLYVCNGTGAQKFTVAGGIIKSKTTGFCVTVKNAKTANGTTLVMKKCNGSASQKWAYKGACISGQPCTTGQTGGSATGSSGGGTTTPKPSTPTPAPAPSNTNTASDQFGPAFGSRKLQTSPINCNGQSNVTISGYTFKGIGNDRPAITINNCTNVTITANDFIDDCEPIYVVNSKNVKITWNRYRNITGPWERNGTNRGNFTQWVNTFGGLIANNKGIGGDTEDIISIYKSGGNSNSDPLIVEKNQFEGTNWRSGSGSGIMLGDSGGGYTVVRNNILVTPGQVGIGIVGGHDVKMQNNTIYGARHANSNIGLYVANYGGGPMRNMEVSGNQVDFRNAAGMKNGGWTDGSAGTIAGWGTNNFDANLNYESLRVKL